MGWTQAHSRLSLAHVYLKKRERRRFVGLAASPIKIQVRLGLSLTHVHSLGLIDLTHVVGPSPTQKLRMCLARLIFSQEIRPSLAPRNVFVKHAFKVFLMPLILG
jgi:exopolyphosphatase/pppGpp-phosphohydrolase